jgi:type IV pilus assembly protein PilC
LTAAAGRANGSFLQPRVAIKRHRAAKLQDVLSFFRQLTTLFRSGTPLYQGLMIASEQTESNEMSRIVQSLADGVAGGSSLSEAMRAHPKTFRDEWCEIVRCGELSGELDAVLTRLCEQVEEVQAFRAKIASAMFYPCMILIVSIGAVLVMMTLVVPTFKEMFAEFGKELPGPTQSLVAISDDLRARGGAYAIGLVVAVLAFRSWTRTAGGRRTWNRFLMSLPIVGDLMVQTAMQKFALNLSNLLAAGVSMMESLEIVRGVYRKNPAYEEATARMSQQIGRGATLTQALSSSGLFTSFLVNMTRIGEESGTINEVYTEVARFYRGKVETTVGRLASQVETVLIILMSVMVAAVLIALYLPMFELSA